MRVAIVFACVCVSLQSLPAAQDTPVTSVRASVRARTIAGERVAIENQRDSPLVAWRIGAGAPGGGIYSSDLAGAGVPWSPGSGPIAPHERRVIDLTSLDADSPHHATLLLVAFADGYYERTDADLTAWREARRARANESQYWIHAIDTMPRDSEEMARRYLAQRAVERAGEMSEDVAGLKNRMSTLSREPRSLSSLLAAVNRERAEAQRVLDALAPSLVGALTERAVRSVRFSAEHVTTTSYSVAIENAGTRPLEAFGYDRLDPETGKPRGSLLTDFCTSPVDSPYGTGRIAPGEAREFPLSERIKEDQPPPPVRVRYAMFDDLSFEGPVSDRREVLKQREATADDVAYEINLLTRLAGNPGEMLAIVTTAQAERARQLQELGRPGRGAMLNELVRQARMTPDALLASIPLRKASLEAQRQRLLRHVDRHLPTGAPR